MKSYDLSLQRKDIWCVPSCIQGILRYEGIEISQGYIYKKLAKLGNGFVLINDDKTRKLFRKKGFVFEPYRYNETPFNEPDNLLKEMSEKNNHGIIGVNFHAYLLEEFNDPELKLLNPGNRQIEKKDLVEMLFEMHEKSQGIFGLVKRFS